MNKWIDAAEKALNIVNAATKIPYDFDVWRKEKKPLPDAFIVYFLVSAPPAFFADDKERMGVVRIQVSLFYRNIKIIQTVPSQIIAAFTDAGFFRVGEGRIPYQNDTGHYGWRCDFNFYEKRGN